MNLLPGAEALWKQDIQRVPGPRPSRWIKRCKVKGTMPCKSNTFQCTYFSRVLTAHFEILQVNVSLLLPLPVFKVHLKSISISLHLFVLFPHRLLSCSRVYDISQIKSPVLVPHCHICPSRFRNASKRLNVHAKTRDQSSELWIRGDLHSVYPKSFQTMPLTSLFFNETVPQV